MSQTGTNSQDKLDPQDKGGAEVPPGGNAQMWAALMAKLDAMQRQQNEALNEIKEEIKITNSSFRQDISLLRNDFDEMKNRVTAHDSKLEDMEKFKQNILDDVKVLVAAQAAEAVQEAKQSILEEAKNQTKAQNSQFAESVKEERDNLQEDFVPKRDFLKEKGFNRRLNLILLGLEEPADDADEEVTISTLLQTRLSIPAPKFDSVFRLGVKGEGKRPRPVMLSFSKWSRRCSVWFAKSKINEGQEKKLRLQEDLPLELRWELSTLLKILRKAKSMPETYPDARIKDYKLTINGYSYGIKDLDILPQDLQLSAIATPQSADAVAFFGRDSPFSNHFPCEFDYGGLTFNCLEQYLACQKAKMANNRGLATRIMHSSDPADHKRALNQLKSAVPTKWEAKLEGILLKGLRAKFGQDEHLNKLLLATYPRKLGEASRDPLWGIGLPLHDDKVLDINEWSTEGNLLGRSLELVREEFIRKQGQNQAEPINEQDSVSS